MSDEERRLHDKYLLRLKSYAELMEEGKTYEEWLKNNIVLTDNNCLLLKFARDYEIDLDDVKTHADVLEWVHHLLGKRWVTEENGPNTLSRIIDMMCNNAGIKVYDNCGDKKSQRKKERNALTASLRWRVLHRDGYKCCGCHRTGLPLHVDHVVPVSKGGRTLESNLQTLCEECNIGKGAK